MDFFFLSEVLFLLIFTKILFSHSSFRFPPALRERHRDFSYTSQTHTDVASHHHPGPFVTADEPSLIHHYRPESIAYTRVLVLYALRFGINV